MTLYELTPDGFRPLPLADAARRLHEALCEARPGARTRMRLLGLADLAGELEREAEERGRAARRARYELLELAAAERHRAGNGRREPIRTLEPVAWRARARKGEAPAAAPAAPRAPSAIDA